MSAFKVEQLRAMGLMFLDFYGEGFNICFVFFGVYCVLIGYLIFRSIFLPRILGVLMRRRRSSSRSALPFGLGIDVQAEKQSTYIIGLFLEEIYYILYTWLNSDLIPLKT